MRVCLVLCFQNISSEPYIWMQQRFEMVASWHKLEMAYVSIVLDIRSDYRISMRQETVEKTACLTETLLAPLLAHRSFLLMGRLTSGIINIMVSQRLATLETVAKLSKDYCKTAILEFS